MSGKPRKNTSDFIIAGKRVHEDKYDYSKVNYLNSKTKVCIICPEHGEFWQNRNHHIVQKNGCPICGGKLRLSTDIFIKNAKNVHGNAYDYSKSNYKNWDTKICILCPEHGEFWQTAGNHLSGRGCNLCNGNIILSTKEFITKAKEVHGNYYDYSKSTYVLSNIKICILCPEHGEFWQTANNHLRGQHCPMCKSSNGEKVINRILIENNIKFAREYTFQDCKFNELLRFDFYLEDYNTLIEFDGEQHFKAMDYFGGDSAFESQKLRDSIKTKYAKDHNIELLRIPYYDFNNIPKIINTLML